MLLIHVHDRAPDALGPAGLRLTDQTIDAVDAGAPSFRGLSALAGAGGTTIVTGAAEYLALQERLVDALGTQVTAALVDDPSDTVGWFASSPGTSRQLVRQEGEIVSDEGTASAAEAGRLDQDTVLEWLERATGLSLPWPDGTEAVLLAPA